MDKGTLLFGLSASTTEVLGCFLDLKREDGLVDVGLRDLDFYEVFCGAANLSTQMEEASMMHFTVFEWEFFNFVVVMLLLMSDVRYDQNMYFGIAARWIQSGALRS